MGKSEESIDSRLEKMTGLFQKDPEAFERMRQELIHQTIESFPEEARKRATGLQFTIDATLDKCKDSTTRMNTMVELFWKQFYKFQEAVTDPDSLVRTKKYQEETAKVIPLHSKSRAN